MIDRETAFSRAQRRVNLFALLFHVIAPIVYIIIIYYLSKSMYKEGAPIPNPGPILLYALIAVCFLELITAMFLFRVLPKFLIHKAVNPRRFSASQKNSSPNFALIAQSIAIMVFSFSEAISVQGMLLFILGYGKYIWVPFFAATIIAYFINRPDRTFLEKLWSKLETMGLLETGSDNSTPQPIK